MCAKLYKVLIGDYKYPRPSVAKRYKIQSYKQSQIANIYNSIAANLAAEVTGRQLTSTITTLQSTECLLTSWLDRWAAYQCRTSLQNESRLPSEVYTLIRWTTCSRPSMPTQQNIRGAETVGPKMTMFSQRWRRLATAVLFYIVVPRVAAYWTGSGDYDINQTC